MIVRSFALALAMSLAAAPALSPARAAAMVQDAAIAEAFVRMSEAGVTFSDMRLDATGAIVLRNVRLTGIDEGEGPLSIDEVRLVGVSAGGLKALFAGSAAGPVRPAERIDLKGVHFATRSGGDLADISLASARIDRLAIHPRTAPTVFDDEQRTAFDFTSEASNRSAGWHSLSNGHQRIGKPTRQGE